MNASLPSNLPSSELRARDNRLQKSVFLQDLRYVNTHLSILERALAGDLHCKHVTCVCVCVYVLQTGIADPAKPRAEQFTPPPPY